MSSGKWRPFCRDPNVLTAYVFLQEDWVGVTEKYLRE